MMHINGIILAAGLSSRMGENKLRLPFRGKPILRHVIDLAAALPLASVILVSREETVADMRLPDNVELVINPDPAQGQSSSLRLGLARADGDGYLFFQGDQPLLDAATVGRVLALADCDSIVIPTHAGVPGNPVFFPANCREALMAVIGDRGGRAVREARPNACRYVEIPAPEPLLDVDTPEQYAALAARELPPVFRW